MVPYLTAEWPIRFTVTDANGVTIERDYLRTWEAAERKRDHYLALGRGYRFTIEPAYGMRLPQ